MQTTLRKLTAAWLLVIGLPLPALARGETGVQAWIQLYNGPGGGLDEACAVAVDGSNNVIVTGYSMGSGSSFDYMTIKYSSAGVPLWTNSYNGPINAADYGLAVAVDGSNNVIVTGESNGSGTIFDYATIKYSSAGVPLWTNRYDGPASGSDRPCAVAVDRNNDVSVTGSSPGIGSSFDYATIKYSSAGDLLWINRYTGPGAYNDVPTALAVDGNNDVIVTGSSFSSPSMMSSDYATIKYSSAGVPLWTNFYDGPVNGPDRANALAVDGNNDVIVTGESAGTGSGFDYATIKYSSAGVPLWTNRYANGSAYALAVDGSNNVIVTGSSSNGYVTIKYSSAGVPLWTNSYNGPGNGDDEAVAVAVDHSGNVIVTGYSGRTNTYPYNYDYATVKYSSAGALLWANRYNGPGNGDDEPLGVAVDHCNNVIVTGFTTGSGGTSDFATIKYICVPSPVMTCLQRTSGKFQMRVDDVLQPGTLVIETCTNLAGWVPLFTNTTPTNVVFYTDPQSSSAPARLYRAFQSP